tara:strand:+ start:206 stop:487 length:282 start_codon:yes stop_codon:yes gene_type:complete
MKTTITNIDKGLHLIKYTGDGSTSKMIWNANPVERLIKSLDEIKGKLTHTEMVLRQTLDVIEYASKELNIDWKKMYLELYRDAGYVEGQTEDE